MISLNQGAQPQILIDNGEDWTAEYVNWNQNRVGTEPDRYRHPLIRSALEAETHAKCAYCEGLINDVAYTNIEHKLPKKKHPTLVCAWQNLTIACPRCNINKGEYDEPDCPLLDPYTDNVEYEVAFAGPLALPRGGPRAHVTISVLDLNRTDLFLRRKPALESLHRLLGLVERAANQPAALRALWLDIDATTAAAGEYASACRQFLTAQMAERSLTRP